MHVVPCSRTQRQLLCWPRHQYQRSALLRAGKTREWEGVGRGWGRFTAATYVALLKQVGVIPAVVEQPLPRVPHVTKKAEVDVGIRSRTFKFPSAHCHAVPDHWQAERGTQLAGSPLLPALALLLPTSEHCLPFSPRLSSGLTLLILPAASHQSRASSSANPLSQTDQRFPILANCQNPMGNFYKNSDSWAPPQTSQVLVSRVGPLKLHYLQAPTGDSGGVGSVWGPRV